MQNPQQEITKKRIIHRHWHEGGWGEKSCYVNQGCQFHSVLSRITGISHFNYKNKTNWNIFHLPRNLGLFKKFSPNFSQNVQVLFCSLVVVPDCKTSFSLLKHWSTTFNFFHGKTFPACTLRSMTKNCRVLGYFFWSRSLCRVTIYHGMKDDRRRMNANLFISLLINKEGTW